MTSEEKVFYDAVWQRASLDLQKHKDLLDATIRFYLNTWGVQLSKECVRQCLQIAGFAIQQQGGNRANAQPLASTPSYSTHGTVIANNALTQSLQPWIEQIRQAGWGSAQPPCVSTQAGQSAQEFLRTTGVYSVAADLGIAESAITSLVLSGAVSLVSAAEIHVRHFTATLPNGVTIQRSQGVIEVNIPTDVVGTEGREILGATRKALGEAQSKKFDEEDERLCACMLRVDKEGQVPRHTNAFWKKVCETYNTDLRAEDHKTWRALAARARRNGLRDMLPRGWGHGATE